MYLSFKPTGRCRSPGKVWKPGAAITHLSGRGVGGCPFHSGGALNSPVSCAARSSRKKNDFKSHVPSFFFRLWERGVGERVRLGSPTAKAAGDQKAFCDKFPVGCFYLHVLLLIYIRYTNDHYMYINFSNCLRLFLTPFHLGSLKEKSFFHYHFFFRILSLFGF